METDAVIEGIRKMGGPLVERSSITPQLSRLKATGLISHDGRLWRLPAAAPQKDETPGVSPPSVSDEEFEELFGGSPTPAVAGA